MRVRMAGLRAVALLTLGGALGAASARAQVAPSEYGQRRDSLMARLKDGVLVAVGGKEPEEDYLSFYQREPFYYLTGVKEPNAALVMVKLGGAVSGTLFVESRLPAREVWTGRRMGAEGATRREVQVPTVGDFGWFGARARSGRSSTPVGEKKGDMVPRRQSVRKRLAIDRSVAGV